MEPKSAATEAYSYSVAGPRCWAPSVDTGCDGWYVNKDGPFPEGLAICTGQTPRHTRPTASRKNTRPATSCGAQLVGLKALK